MLARAVIVLIAGLDAAQTPPAFDVASVKPTKSDARPYSNIPLGPGDVYTPNGGLLSTTAFPLATYIFFAYKIQGNQGNALVKQLPAWVMSDRFDIQARAPGNPSKDEMRLMMRALLADRFQLRLHTETREESVLAVVLAKPDKLGPRLQPHTEDPPCSTTTPPASAGLQAQNSAALAQTAAGFPVLCNGVFGMPSTASNHIRAGARNLSMDVLAGFLSGEGTFGRPIVDATGLTGKYDFAIDWAPQPQTLPPPGSGFTPDPDGPSFEQAIHDQLGLKLESRKSSIEVIVLDHIERPSEN